MIESALFEQRKFVVPEFVFGENALNRVGQYCQNFGAQKVLVVTDSGVKKAGWTRKVEAALKRFGIDYVVFYHVTPNPKDTEVMAGVEIYNREKCDVIVAVGGGSPMDCAKGIGIVSTNKRHILDFEGVDEVDIPGPPLICIPTTAGTSADVSQFCIISDTVRNVKIAIISKTVVPDAALIDPVCTTSMDAQLTAATGMDAMVHAFEAYVSNASSHLTDLNAIEAVRLILQNLKGAISSPADMTFRGNMMMGSLLAGIAFSNASLGLVHGMAHSLGGALDLAHGDCNSILLEHVVKFNYDAAEEKYQNIGSLMALFDKNLPFEPDMSDMVDAISRFRHEVGIHQTLGDLGVIRADIPLLAQNAFNDACVATNPKSVTIRDIERVYEQAL
jgi:alcohol dehydrogenase class IV